MTAIRASLAPESVRAPVYRLLSRDNTCGAV